MIPQTNQDCKTACFIAYANFNAKKIILQDLLTELAYITITYCLNGVKYQFLPSVPFELLEYENLNNKEKDKVGSDFWKQGKVLAYQLEKNRVLRENLSNQDWLMQCLENLPKEDILNRNKIQEVLNGYAKI